MSTIDTISPDSRVNAVESGEAPAWLHNLLVDPSITDICINGPNGSFVDRGQGLESIEAISGNPAHFSESGLKIWVIAQLSKVGKSWDAKSPYVDAGLPSGHRLHAIFPPLSQQGILVSLRRLPWASRHLFAQAEKRTPVAFERWKDSKGLELIISAVQRGDCILISGSTGSGKTTLASDLLEFAPPDQRIVALEDTPELAPIHPHFLSLVSRNANADGFGEVTLRTLLKQALRMRPDRIVLGECRGAEVLDLLQALNTGHTGAIATLHANSPRDALRRVELLSMLAGQASIPLGAIRELLCHGVQWVVQVKRQAQRRSISEIWRLEGKEGDTLLMRPFFSESDPAAATAQKGATKEVNGSKFYL